MMQTICTTRAHLFLNSLWSAKYAVKNMSIKMTTKRKQILEVLQKHHGTLSAKEIHSVVPEIDLVTIYRALEAFVEAKMIKRMHLNETEAVYEHQKEPHHHAVCSDCHKMIHFKAPDEKIKKLLGIENFDVDEIEVTVKGLCKR